ncbi:MAG: hypothetical protein ABJA82_09950 [Myxococcales bacterium]
MSNVQGEQFCCQIRAWENAGVEATSGWETGGVPALRSFATVTSVGSCPLLYRKAALELDLARCSLAALTVWDEPGQAYLAQGVSADWRLD